MTKRKKILIGAGVVLGLLIVIGILSPDEEDPAAPASAPRIAAVQPTPTSRPTATPVPAPSVTAVDLYQERKDNATRFDLQRKDKWVSITGMVGQVEDGDIRLVVDEDAYRLLGSLFIEYIALQDLPDAVQASVDKGQQFTATCKVGNFILGTMFLKDCTTQ